jgi:2,3-bisphosphoglycerate-independent phosphoglycerate mutase
MTKPERSVLLMILDGWGYRESREANAVALAETPFLDEAVAKRPHTLLSCSGESVGLPEGVMGNSEVGHLNIGAGRVVYQDLVRIDRAIKDGSLAKNEVLNNIIDKVNSRKTALHFMGLVSDGGVHSHISHLLALLDLAKARGVHHIYVHAILDGRDTAPDSGISFIKTLQDHIDRHKTGAIATLCGRYYAMDRDNRWDRIEKAYRLYTRGEGVPGTDPVSAIQEAYQNGQTDEFVKPIVMTDANGSPRGTITQDDGIFFFNFRGDRAREIARAFTQPDFSFFTRSPQPKLCEFVCMSRYDEKLMLPVAFPPIKLREILGQVVSERGLKQLRIAETEKYAHVTYFFNGGEEAPFPLEDRCLIPSPRDVATYDLKPQMSAIEVADTLVDRLEKEDYSLVVLNFANMDMVGHSGKLEAAIKACETVDRCAGRVASAALKKGMVVLITADHGNAETMAQADGSPQTAHTTNPVRLILMDDLNSTRGLRTGILGDVAPTILDLMHIGVPAEMTGRSLLVTSNT